MLTSLLSKSLKITQGRALNCEVRDFLFVCGCVKYNLLSTARRYIRVVFQDDKCGFTRGHGPACLYLEHRSWSRKVYKAFPILQAEPTIYNLNLCNIKAVCAWVYVHCTDLMPRLQLLSLKSRCSGLKEFYVYASAKQIHPKGC